MHWIDGSGHAGVSGRETGYRTVALVPMSLRLEAVDGSASEEYRIRDGDIEVRSIEPAEAARNGVVWHRITSKQLSNHVERNTIVAQWLRHRIGWRRLILKCADQEALESFGVADNAEDRFAA